VKGIRHLGTSWVNGPRCSCASILGGLSLELCLELRLLATASSVSVAPAKIRTPSRPASLRVAPASTSLTDIAVLICMLSPFVFLFLKFASCLQAQYEAFQSTLKNVEQVLVQTTIMCYTWTTSARLVVSILLLDPQNASMPQRCLDSLSCVVYSAFPSLL